MSAGSVERSQDRAKYSVEIVEKYSRLLGTAAATLRYLTCNMIAE